MSANISSNPSDHPLSKDPDASLQSAAKEATEAAGTAVTPPSQLPEGTGTKTIITAKSETMAIPKSEASDAASKKSATMILPKSKAVSKAASRKSATMVIPKSDAPSEASSKKSATMVIPKSDAPSEASSKKSATMVIPKSEAPSEASSKKSATMTLPKSKAPSEAASKKSATMAIPKPEFQTRQILYEQPGMPDEEKASKIASDESEDAVIATESRAGPRYVYPDKRDPGFLPYMRSGSVSLEIQASLTSDTVVEVDPAVIRKRNLGQMEWVLSRIYGFMDTDMPEIWRPRPSGSRYNSQRDLAGDTWGVLNLITLYNETRQIEFVYKARALIKEVHEVLGRARLDEKDLAGRSRRWSQVFVRPPERLGLSTDDHPVLGGLRDGYDIHEKYVEGDGQTFENLLRWAYALNRFALWTRDVTYNDQAVELLQLAHRAFCKRPGSDRPRFMYRMDVDRTK
ncbi:MAG: uncharacterized protein KVP18_002437 [Porospora cf. gigantea A]|uniref:uncharacterized protein n=1 Tax=Porospora cf. gigantea A TaxID=2853593 RepID=UPI003559E4B0|nr:MAG: hypothetical protein KVP18_002437 [Porospora cf. gigantea A]